MHLAQDHTQTQSQRAGIQVLARMCIAWGGGLEPPVKNPNKKKDAILSTQQVKPRMHGFDSWIQTVLVPLLLRLPRQLNAKDAASTIVLNEIAQCHRTLYAGQGEEYIGLLKLAMEKEGANADLCSNFAQTLRSADVKVVVKALREFAG